MLHMVAAIPTMGKGGQMTTKVAPYHTSHPDYGRQRNVYHNDNACPDGRKIKPEHRNAGMSGRPLCKECARL
jgi:hypothetical protein